VTGIPGTAGVAEGRAQPAVADAVRGEWLHRATHPHRDPVATRVTQQVTIWHEVRPAQELAPDPQALVAATARSWVLGKVAFGPP
jgi:hypothetical protein